MFDYKYPYKARKISQNILWQLCLMDDYFSPMYNSSCGLSLHEVLELLLKVPDMSRSFEHRRMILVINLELV